MNYSIILNHHAGNGNADKAWSLIQPFLDQQKINYRLETTKYPNHATYLSSRIAQVRPHDETVVIVIGGDGTLHQVINGLMKTAREQNRSPLPVGYIPAGADHNFALGYGIALQPLKALQQILAATSPTMINIGHYHEAIRGEDGYFLNNLGIGFDAEIISRTNTVKARHKTGKVHRLTYLRKALGVMYDQEPFTLMVQDGIQRFLYSKAYIAIASNHPFTNGGFRVSSGTSLATSQLELVVAERKNWLMTSWQLIQFARGKLDKSHFAHHFQGNDLHFTTSSLEFIQADGEEMGNRFVDMAFDTALYPIWQTAQ
ncbi:diacylglycerol/lipid kinase family protein [Limosilactobacillus caccae]|uniref:diacylglycerol/lipid kinase family protein n=1 Tax=Limosilactobacillus caccae TaxID=1926284 RepID=UPI0009702C9D|nr:diacylglycerol kinase family protein [Limosilactobacillus caccae]